jgi:hypothetical protein
LLSSAGDDDFAQFQVEVFLNATSGLHQHRLLLSEEYNRGLSVRGPKGQDHVDSIKIGEAIKLASCYFADEIMNRLKVLESRSKHKLMFKQDIHELDSYVI